MPNPARRAASMALHKALPDEARTEAWKRQGDPKLQWVYLHAWHYPC